MESDSNDSADLIEADDRGASVKSKTPGKWVDFGIAVVVWGVVEYVLVKVVPVFADVYDQFGGKLPWGTRVVLCFSRFPGLMAVPVILAGLVAFQLWRVRCLPAPSPEDSRRRWDSLVVLTVILLGGLVILFGAFACYLPVVRIAEQINSR